MNSVWIWVCSTPLLARQQAFLPAEQAVGEPVSQMPHRLAANVCQRSDGPGAASCVRTRKSQVHEGPCAGQPGADTRFGPSVPTCLLPAMVPGCKRNCLAVGSGHCLGARARVKTSQLGTASESCRDERTFAQALRQWQRR